MIETIEAMEKFLSLEKNKDKLHLVDGNCANCAAKAKCAMSTRETILKNIKELSPDKTRYPALKKAADTFPFLLSAVPNAVYRKMGYFDFPLGCPYMAGQIADNMDKVKKVYSMLSDERSKKIYIRLLMHRITIDNRFLDGINEGYEKQYMDESALKYMNENTVYADCGGFIGDTFESYLKRAPMPKKYIFFEPGEQNIEGIKKVIKKEKAENNTEIVPAAVYSKTGSIYFTFFKSRGDCSQVSESYTEGAEELKAIRLDDFLDRGISFVKMDIEGSEQAALRGGARILNENKPALAVCIYHRTCDMFEIPLLIKEIEPGYNKFIVRHYSRNSAETVLYAFAD